jgi:hypothetical protein
MKRLALMVLVLSVVGAQMTVGETNTVITSFHGNGELTWAASTNTTYEVQWAPAPDGPWTSSWDSLTFIDSSLRTSVTVRVPMFYRVVTPAGSLVVIANPKTLPSNGDASAVIASGGTPPYIWSVTDAGLGQISGGSGAMVVYTRTGVGDNYVRATDSQGISGMAKIHQP